MISWSINIILMTSSCQPRRRLPSIPLPRLLLLFSSPSPTPASTTPSVATPSTLYPGADWALAGRLEGAWTFPFSLLDNHYCLVQFDVDSRRPPLRTNDGVSTASTLRRGVGRHAMAGNCLQLSWSLEPLVVFVQAFFIFYFAVDWLFTHSNLLTHSELYVITMLLCSIGSPVYLFCHASPRSLCVGCA